MSDPQSTDGRQPRKPGSTGSSSSDAPGLSDLSSRLKAARGREQKARALRQEDPTSSKAAMGYALRVGVELAAGLVVGGGLGWLLDEWFGTMPLMLILFFFLGAGAGIRNVFRTAQEINQAQAAQGNSRADDQTEDRHAGDRGSQ